MKSLMTALIFSSMTSSAFALSGNSEADQHNDNQPDVIEQVIEEMRTNNPEMRDMSDEQVVQILRQIFTVENLRAERKAHQ